MHYSLDQAMHSVVIMADSRVCCPMEAVNSDLV